ncbi:MAG: hypothetical protein Q9194_002323 [Teloschistes cf. exilis]
MTPRNLFLTFPSWQSAKTPDRTPPEHTNALTHHRNDIACNPYSAKTEPSTHDHVSAQTVFDSETAPFDELPAGDWNPETPVDDTNYLGTHEVKSAFPKLTLYNHKHAWGIPTPRANTLPSVSWTEIIPTRPLPLLGSWVGELSRRLMLYNGRPGTIFPIIELASARPYHTQGRTKSVYGGSTLVLLVPLEVLDQSNVYVNMDEASSIKDFDSKEIFMTWLETSMARVRLIMGSIEAANASRTLRKKQEV